MMPSLDHCISKPADMTTLTNSLEVFDTYKHREDKDSDEESFHLPLDDDESETKSQDPIKNGSGNETEDEILNKFDSTNVPLEQIDSQLEDCLLNEDEGKKENKSDIGLNAQNKESFPANRGVNGETSSDKNTSDTSDGRTKTNEWVDRVTIGNGDTVVDNAEAVTSDVACNDVPNVDQEEKLYRTNESACAIDRSSGNSTAQLGQESSKLDKSKDNEEISVKINGQLESFNKKSLDSVEQSHLSPSHENTSTYNNLVEKCDNSNDSSKNQNEDSEDLFDISIIRDADEDNAESAYNEAHAEENEDYDRNDDKGEDDCVSDKVNHLEEEEEEMDIDKHEDQLKSDDVDIEEGNLKLDCEGVRDAVSDGESDNCNKTDLVQINNKSRMQETTDTSNATTGVITECRLDEITGDLIPGDSLQVNCKQNLDQKDTLQEGSDHASEDSQKRRSLKRTIFDEGEIGATKKLRTEQVADVEIKEVEKPKEKLPLKTLVSLSDFMKPKKNSKRLTMHDLEEFCVQKICEVIVHKSELGDVHHQLKLQEQIIETMRREIQQLTKQARDLEIVNKKLMNDLKQQTATQKPLNPLKITRSVGLQVKFTPQCEANMKRRQPNASITTQKVQIQQAAPPRGPRNIPNAVPPGPSRQITSPQKPQQQIVKPNTPLLSQALQNRRVGVNDSANKVTPQVMRTKPADPKSGAPSASVIDLTDEDDKKDKNKNSALKMIPPKNITVPLRTSPLRVNTTQGIRLTTSQGKVSPITSVVTSSAPQVMYVVQSSPQNVLTSPLGSKAVVVNFQSANGVLTSALNGSAVSVIPKQSNTIQLKTVAPAKTLANNKLVKMPSKHPAPLPSPPVVRINPDKPLKPIPPKPHLTIRKTDTGIILQWKMPYELDMYEIIASYQLYAYQETSALPSTDMWRKVGDVKALALPMACTLTQFADKNKYYFAVRPVDIHKRIGMFSDPEEISL
jgi:hypothetical protein